MHWTSRISNILSKNKFYNTLNYIQSICIVAMMLSISTMIIASCTISGFESTIKNKVFNFWSHIRIVPFTLSQDNLLFQSFVVAQSTIDSISNDKSVAIVQKICNKGVLLQRNNDIEGVILRGLNLQTEFQKVENNLISTIDTSKLLSGEIPLCISQVIANKMNASLGKKIAIQCIENDATIKTGRVIAIFKTNIEEFDEKICLTSIESVQKLNNWQEDSISAIEITLKSIDNVPNFAKTWYQKLPNLNVMTIQEIYPQIFDWLKLMAQNEYIVIFVMLIVSIINIISTISIYILDRTRMIGLLKILGATKKDIQKLFFIETFKIIFRGIIWGNLFGIIVVWFINEFQLIPLDESSYYISYAPMYIDWWKIGSINLISILVSAFSLLIPLKIIQTISPIEVAQYQ